MMDSFRQKNIKRTLITVGLFIGVFILNNAQAQELENSLLWRIEKADIKTSFVYGTFHLLPQEDFELKEKVKRAFESVELVVMELDMDDGNMQAEMMRNMQMKGGMTLDQLMTKDDLKLLDDQLSATVNLTAEQVNTFKPFMVETFLLPSFIEGTPASYEMTFVQMAISKTIAIEGLEEVSDQINLFDQIPYEKQAEDLLDILKNRQNMEKLFARMIDIYKKEDINGLYQESLDYFDEEEVSILLNQRNVKWIEKMADFSKEKATFFAVGAGHLGGELGVITLLRQAGYKVTPILE
ncbi:MAG: TraB/GumN family protein [Ekhidna sp.]